MQPEFNQQDQISLLNVPRYTKGQEEKMQKIMKNLSVLSLCESIANQTVGEFHYIFNSRGEEIKVRASAPPADFDHKKARWQSGLGDFWKDWLNSSLPGGQGIFSFLCYLQGLPYGEDFKALSNFEKSKVYIQTYHFFKESFLNDQFELDSSKKISFKDSGGYAYSAKTKQVFERPPALKKAEEEVVQYLSVQRGIPESIVRMGIKEGIITAVSSEFVKPAINTSVAFWGTDNGEIREMGGNNFKGAFIGSDTKVSGFIFPAEESIVFEEDKLKVAKIAIVEAAVDALSFRALYPDHLVISSNGSVKFELQYGFAAEAIDNGCELKIAMDNDKAGHVASQMLFNALAIRQIFKDAIKDKAFSPDLGITLERVDSWIANGDIKVNLNANVSPHLLWFNDPLKREFYVKYDHLNVKEEGENIKLLKARPTIEFSISRGLLPILSGEGKLFNATSDGKVSYILTEEDRDDLLKKLKGVKRLCPLNAKDWNDELKAIDGYKDGYQQCVELNFRNDKNKVLVPDIPTDIAIYRQKNLESEKAIAIFKKYFPSTLEEEVVLVRKQAKEDKKWYEEKRVEAEESAKARQAEAEKEIEMQMLANNKVESKTAVTPQEIRQSQKVEDAEVEKIARLSKLGNFGINIQFLNQIKKVQAEENHSAINDSSETKINEDNNVKKTIEVSLSQDKPLSSLEIKEKINTLSSQILKEEAQLNEEEIERKVSDLKEVVLSQSKKLASQFSLASLLKKEVKTEGELKEDFEKTFESIIDFYKDNLKKEEELSLLKGELENALLREREEVKVVETILNEHYISPENDVDNEQDLRYEYVPEALDKVPLEAYMQDYVEEEDNLTEYYINDGDILEQVSEPNYSNNETLSEVQFAGLGAGISVSSIDYSSKEKEPVVEEEKANKGYQITEEQRTLLRNLHKGLITSGNAERIRQEAFKAGRK